VPAAQPTLPEFLAEAEVWLSAHAERRPPESDLRYGDGSDSVAIFENLDGDALRARVDTVRHWQQAKSDAGLGSIAWPTEYGGRGLPRSYEQAFRSLEEGFVTPLGHEAVGITTDLVAPTILTVGTAEQKARYLEPMRRTDEMWCQLFSEPSAGSDLASVSTKAERHGDSWLLNGQKVWTSGAQFADFGYILCRDDATAPRHGGLTAFIMAMDAPGVEVRPLRQMTGGTSFNEVFLTDVELPDSARLGPVGEGWRVAITTLGFERASATKTAASGGDLFARATLVAKHRGRLADPVVRQALMSVYIGGRVRSLTGRRTTDTLKSGGVPGPEGSIGKLAWTEGLRQLSDVMGLILGPALVADTGEWGTYAWTEFLLGAPGFRIAAGSDEVQRNIISERVLGLPRDPR
jgi:alkylation response protein AidB-like acyl-CoA dehydrogenase